MLWLQVLTVYPSRCKPISFTMGNLICSFPGLQTLTLPFNVKLLQDHGLVPVTNQMYVLNAGEHDIEGHYTLLADFRLKHN